MKRQKQSGSGRGGVQGRCKKSGCGEGYVWGGGGSGVGVVWCGWWGFGDVKCA